MDKRIKALWIDALRSGKYLQGKGALRSPDGYCCLGVLTDLHIKETGEGGWNFIPAMSAPGGASEDYYRHAPSGEMGILPLAVQEWAGLTGNGNDQGCGREGGLKLITRNDNGVAFSEIADIIEENL